MSKTPIMILQELAVKECILPNYDVIYSQDGSHANIFTFRVKYKNLSAEGTAFNKKEAKQNAAQNMLKLLQETNNIPPKILKEMELLNNHVTIPKSSLSSVIGTSANSANFIGTLQEFCAQNQLEQPTYQFCEMINGSAHDITFKMSCTLGSMTVEAVANTKKHAKQLAAYKVLQNLPNVKTIINDGKYQIAIDKTSQETSEAMFKDLGMQIANLKIVDSTVVNTIKLKYLNVTSREDLSSFHVDNKISMENYHLYFKSKIYNDICNSKAETFDILYKNLKTHTEKCRTVGNYDKNSLLVYTEILKYIQNKCNLSIKKIYLPSSTNMSIIGFKVSLFIPFVQFQMSENPIYAEQNALLKTIETIMIYLQ